MTSAPSQSISSLTLCRHVPHPGGYPAAVRLSEDYAARSRTELDTDEPSVDALQALLLLVTAFTAAGKGKKAYMLMSMSSTLKATSQTELTILQPTQ
jgi:hypothetical protein